MWDVYILRSNIWIILNLLSLIFSKLIDHLFILIASEKGYVSRNDDLVLDVYTWENIKGGTHTTF